MDISVFKKCLLIVTISACSFSVSQPVFAYLTTNSQWLLGAAIGVVERNLNSSAQINNGSPVPAPYNIDTFSIRQPSDKAMMKLFGGLQWSTYNSLLPYYSLTLQYEEQFQSTIDGQIQQYGLPQFRNYNYSAKISSSILQLVAKLNLIEYKCMLPYFSVGVGFAWTGISDYNEKNIFPVDPARISPAYAKDTTTNFVYSLGAGLDVILNKNWWAALGYEYLNLGKVHSGNGQGSWSNTRLNFGTLDTNTVFASITYLF